MATAFQEVISSHSNGASAPIVIVGSGPVGVRVAQELLRRQPEQPLVLCGAEEVAPYNRVRLSSLLAGEVTWAALQEDAALTTHPRLELRLGCEIAQIDREHKRVVDARGRVQSYSKLVLALGSQPHIPTLENIALSGVFTFRDFGDAQQLLARRVRSRRTVVLGGGLLGLEAARAMSRFNTEVVVIEHAPRPMPRQLDEHAARLVEQHLAGMGIELICNDGVRRLCGPQRVQGVELMSGRRIDCDTVIIATGINPNIDLARGAGIAVGRGIKVDDHMQTSDADIYAVGECAEHRDRIYGLLAPGLEQAAVAAAVLSGASARYLGSTLATKLKVVGLPVFSIGRVVDDDLDLRARCYLHQDDAGRYSKVIVERGRLVGAIVIGANEGIGRMQEAVARQRSVWPWQLWRFVRTGQLWPQQRSNDVALWPVNTTVCNCTGVTRGQLSAAVANGACTVEALARFTGASSVCGTCRPLVAQLAGSSAPSTPVRAARGLIGVSIAAMLAAVALLLPFHVPYATSVQTSWHIDFLWRESFWKQVSGYTVLGLSVLVLTLSLRKRIRRIRWGHFDLWRLAHALIGAAVVIGLWVHTGGRVGTKLDLTLMTCFLAVLVLGGIAATSLAREHRGGMQAIAARRRWTWLHLLVFWPVPALLGWHIFKTYYF
jgi:nitrite reductase (NADH) large subunit